jgi:predicted transcriptional regulator of viral defense system
VGDKLRGQLGEQGAGRHQPLFTLATEQHGVVSTRQLAGLGYTRSSASKAHRVGRLRRIHRGVYAVGHRDLDWEGWAMAAVLACIPAARHGRLPVASHLTAGWLWGLLRFRPETPHVTVPGARPHRRRRFVIHGGSLIDRDVAEQDRIPVTSLPRTLLDLATILSADALGTAIQRADKQGIFDLRGVDDVLGRTGRHNGAGRLREAAALYRPDLATTRSKLERRFRSLIREAGLPEPAMNYVVAGFELDAYWEAERFVVELDVYGTHGDPGAFERDRLREDDLLLHGIEMMRVTDTRLNREPRETVERVAFHLERRRRELGPGPP